MILYRYVGPTSLLGTLSSLDDRAHRARVETAGDLRKFQVSARGSQIVIATFVVDAEGALWIADRHSEHVICARGGLVRAAGEIEFLVSASTVRVVGVTNQSTGYCPEPSSWTEVARALDAVGIAHPGGFTIALTFRRCTTCAQINVVKGDWFYCDVCDHALPVDAGFSRQPDDPAGP